MSPHTTFCGKRFIAAVGAAALAVLLVPTAAQADPPIPSLAAPVVYDDPDPEANLLEYFHNFKLEYFLPATDNEVQAFIGTTQSVPPESRWDFNSYNSHAVGWSTALPAVGAVEWGPTANYGHVTTPEDSYYYNHLAYLTGLEEGTTYHYRLLYRGTDGITRASSDNVFTTKTFTSDIVRLPEDRPAGPPYVIPLDENGTTYVLTQDIVAPQGGFWVKGGNITIDLNGHTLTYDNEEALVSSIVDCAVFNNPDREGVCHNPHIYTDDPDATAGIRTSHPAYNLKIYNGTIVQGANGGAADSMYNIGFSPIYNAAYQNGDGFGNVVAGVTIFYRGDGLRGMQIETGADTLVTHNVAYDLGTEALNRNQQSRVMTGHMEASYNSVRRARQSGIGLSSGNLTHNEVYGDSYSTNSILIGPADGSLVEDNVAFGMGFNPQGYGWGSGATLRHNLAYMQFYSPTQRYPEYSWRKSGGGGFRYTDYGTYAEGGVTAHNQLWEFNTSVVKCWEGCGYAKAFWMSGGTGESSLNNVMRNNVAKAEIMQDPQLGIDTFSNYEVAALEIHGAATPWDDNPFNDFLIENNRLMGNFQLIEFSSSYGVGGGAVLKSNTYERITHDDAQFQPIRLGWYQTPSLDNRIIDAIEGPGVNLLTPEQNVAPVFEGPERGSAHTDLTYIRTLNAVFRDAAGGTLANATINVYLDGRAAGTIRTDAAGRANYQVLEGHYGHGYFSDLVGGGGYYSEIGFGTAGGSKIMAVKALSTTTSITLDGAGWAGSAGALNSTNQLIKPVAGADVWPLLPGVYRLHGGLDAYALENRNGVIGAVAAYTNAAGQQFEISFTDDGYAVIKSVVDNLVLTASPNDGIYGGPLRLTALNGQATEEQKWWIAPQPGGTYRIQPKAYAPTGMSIGRPGWLQGDVPADEWNTPVSGWVYPGETFLEPVAVPDPWEGFVTNPQPGTFRVGWSTISGEARVGSTVTANAGTWVPVPDSYTYKWKLDGKAIPGATQVTYTPVAADVGKRLTVVVTGQKVGYTTALKTSPGVVVTAATPRVEVGAVTVGGQVKVGAMADAQVTGVSPAGANLSYQWLVAGVAVAGATGQGYAPQAADVGKKLSVRVTATLAGYDTAAVMSPAVDIALGVLEPGTVKLVGSARVGQTLSVNPGVWGPGAVTLSYRWRVGGAVVPGATSSTYVPQAADAGQTVSVVVTGTKTGYGTMAVASGSARVK
ncbi:MAG: hypothetical protein LBR27_05585 [Bifidobacteriaceae bacterium]|jgi:hypothetical protein|nr:hypothetical protein [Bifidobacteriaceae bacterium]